MISAPTLIASPGQVRVPITVDETIGAIQFDLLFDPAALTFVDWETPEGALAIRRIINPIPGREEISISQTVPLPNIVATFIFEVTGSTTLTLVDVVAGTPLGEPVPLEIINGEITLENNVNLRLSWTDENTPVIGVTEFRVYASNDAGGLDPVLVTSVPYTANEAFFSVADDGGDLYFFLTAFNGRRESIPSEIVSLRGSIIPLPPRNIFLEQV